MAEHVLAIDKKYVGTFADLRDARSVVGYLKRDDQSYSIISYESETSWGDAEGGREAPRANLWRKQEPPNPSDGIPRCQWNGTCPPRK